MMDLQGVECGSLDWIDLARGRDRWPTVLTLSLLMSHICGVSKKFGEWYQKTNKTEDTSKLTLLAFKIITILHNTRLATFIKLLETVSKGLFRNRSQYSRHTLLDCNTSILVLLQDHCTCFGYFPHPSSVVQ
jgi:hypothetical protein